MYSKTCSHSRDPIVLHDFAARVSSHSILLYEGNIQQMGVYMYCRKNGLFITDNDHLCRCKAVCLRISPLTGEDLN